MRIQKKLAPKELGVTNEIFEVLATEVDSDGAGAGDVLTADGAGGSSWQPGNDGDMLLVGDGWSLLGGGDDRGLGAVDMQYTRTNDTQVASGDYSTIGGGTLNTASGIRSTIGGGLENTASGGNSTIGGGLNNTASGYKATIGGGVSNTASNYGAIVSGGYNNIASGEKSTVSGGRDNEVHGNGSVIGGGSFNTINAGESNATISGGTLNTITKSSSTICGGENNTISGYFSTIGGGENNDNFQQNSVIGGGSNNVINVGGNYSAGHHVIAGGTNNTVVGGDYSSYSVIGGGHYNTVSSEMSTIGGGGYNTASGRRATVGGGYENQASGHRTTIGGGSANTATMDAATIGGGENNQASGAFATIPGGYAAKADKYGQFSYASGVFSVTGDAQTSVLVARKTTNDNTPTELFTDGGSERITIVSDTTWTFEILVTARRIDADNESAGYHFLGVIDNNAGTTALVGAVAKTVIAEDTGAWDCNVTADDANDALVITATGENAKTIYWVARVTLVETTG